MGMIDRHNYNLVKQYSGEGLLTINQPSPLFLLRHTTTDKTVKPITIRQPVSLLSSVSISRVDCYHYYYQDCNPAREPMSSALLGIVTHPQRRRNEIQYASIHSNINSIQL